MSISTSLFKAILALDSYNRGYGEGIVGLGGVGSLIGNARLETQSGSSVGSPERLAGFYAAAYDMTGVTGFSTGEKIISYRGTDDIFSLSASNDPYSAYGIALGGGLAGYISALTRNAGRHLRTLKAKPVDTGHGEADTDSPERHGPASGYDDYHRRTSVRDIGSGPVVGPGGVQFAAFGPRLRGRIPAPVAPAAAQPAEIRGLLHRRTVHGLP